MRHVFIINKSNNKNVDKIYELIDVKAKEYGLDYLIRVVESDYTLITNALYYGNSNTIIYPVGVDHNINLLLDSNLRLGIMPIGCKSEIYDNISKSGKIINQVDVKRINGIYTLSTVTLGLESIVSKDFNATIDTDEFMYDYSKVSGIVIKDGIKLLMEYNFLDKCKYLNEYEYNKSKTIDMSNCTNADIYVSRCISADIDDEYKDSSFSINTKYDKVEIIDNHQLTRNLVK